MIKRFLLPFMVALVAISLILASCATSEPVAPPTAIPTTPSTATPTTPTPAPAGEVFEFVYTPQSPLGTTWGDDALAFAADVEKATGGRILIDVKGAGELVGGHDLTEGVHNGIIDLGSSSTTEDTGLLGPVTYLMGGSGFPGGPTPMEYMAWYYTGGGADQVNAIYQSKFDIEVIGHVATYPAELFCHSNIKITSVEDFDGLKFRTVGPWAEVLESFGASVISIPGNEVYEAAQRGLIDAFEYAGPAINWVQGFQEITKYLGVPGIHSPNAICILRMNKGEWDALPEDLQATMKMVANSHALTDYLEQQTRDAYALQQFVDYGIEIVPLPEEMQQKIVERSKEFVQKHIDEDPLYKAMYEDQVEFMQNWKKYQVAMMPEYSIYVD